MGDGGMQDESAGVEICDLEVDRLRLLPEALHDACARRGGSRGLMGLDSRGTVR